MDPLVALRSAIAAKLQPVLVRGGQVVDDNEIASAEALRFPPVPGISEEETDVPLSTETRFESKDPETRPLDLRTVYNCWITRDLNVTNYITVSAERGIFNLKFLERTDLLTWLEGASEDSENIITEGKKQVKSKQGESESKAGGKKELDPTLRAVYDKERTLVDHNTVLRGAKKISFASVSTECRQKIIFPYKSAAKTGKPVQSTTTKGSGASADDAKSRKKEPIIILSPSASALLNMANVKQFFEQGRFEYQPSASGAANIQYITRKSQKLGGQIRLVVVNSVDRFKPEYWDRVVAVFVTGQPWQLKPYKWSDPHVLFQQVLGFSLVFKGDPLPPTLKQWNVDVIPIDRNHRFKDSELVERIWDKIEYNLHKRGYKGRR
uniref:ARAD1A18876p n=1 Tax=Blastobotrys adeninivorans TaxID=409370 RepID=A0A060SYQ6_BLAAD